MLPSAHPPPPKKCCRCFHLLALNVRRGTHAMRHWGNVWVPWAAWRCFNANWKIHAHMFYIFAQCGGAGPYPRSIGTKRVGLQNAHSILCAQSDHFDLILYTSACLLNKSIHFWSMLYGGSFFLFLLWFNPWSSAGQDIGTLHLDPWWRFTRIPVSILKLVWLTAAGIPLPLVRVPTPIPG